MAEKQSSNGGSNNTDNLRKNPSASEITNKDISTARLRIGTFEEDKGPTSVSKLEGQTSTAKHNVTVIGTYNHLMGNEDRLDALKLIKESGQETKVIYLQESASMREMMARDMHSYMKVIELYHEVNALATSEGVPLSKDQEKLRGQTRNHFAAVNSASEEFTSAQKRIIAILKENTKLKKSTDAGAPARREQLKDAYKIAQQNRIEADKKLDALLSCRSDVPGGSPEGIMPAGKLTLSLLTSLNELYKRKMDTLSKTGDRLRKLSQENQNDIANKDPLNRRDAFRELQEKMQVSLQKYLRLSGLMGRHHADRAKLGTIKKIFGEQMDTRDIDGVAKTTVDPERKEQMEAMLNERADASLQNISTHLSITKKEAVTRASAEDQFVANLAERLAHLHSAQFPPNLAGMKLIRSAIKGRYRDNVYAVIGWPIIGGEPAPFTSLHPDLQRDISRKLQSIRLKYENFVAADEMGNLEESLAATREILFRIKGKRAGWSNRELYAVGSVRSSGKRITLADVEASGEDPRHTRILVQTAFEQLRNDWDGYHTLRSQLLAEVHEVIGLHFELKGEENMHDFEMKEAGDLMDNAIQFGIAGYFIKRGLSPKTQESQQLAKVMRGKWRTAMRAERNLASTSKFARIKGLFQWIRSGRNAKYISELLKRSGFNPAQVSQLKGAKSATEFMKNLKNVAKQGGKSGDEATAIMRAVMKGDAAGAKAGLNTTKAAAKSSSRLGKFTGRAVPLLIAAYYLYEITQKFGEATEENDRGKDVMEAMGKDMEKAGFVKVEGSDYVYKHKETNTKVSLKTIQEGFDHNVNTKYLEAAGLGVGLAILGLSFAVGGPLGVVIAIGGVIIEVVIEWAIGEWQDVDTRDLLADIPPWLIVPFDVLASVNKDRDAFAALHEISSGINLTDGIERATFSKRSPEEFDKIRDKALFSVAMSDLRTQAPTVLRELFAAGKKNDVEFVNQFFEADFRKVIVPAFYKALRHEMIETNLEGFNTSNLHSRIKARDLLTKKTPKTLITRSMRNVMVLYLANLKEQRFVGAYQMKKDAERILALQARPMEQLRIDLYTKQDQIAALHKDEASKDDIGKANAELEVISTKINILDRELTTYREAVVAANSLLTRMGEDKLFGVKLSELDPEKLSTHNSRAMTILLKLGDNERSKIRTPGRTKSIATDYLSDVDRALWKKMDIVNPTKDGPVKGSFSFTSAAERKNAYGYLTGDPVLGWEVGKLYAMDPKTPGYKKVSSGTEYAVASLAFASAGVGEKKHRQELFSRAYGNLTSAERSANPTRAEQIEKWYVKGLPAGYSRERVTQAAENFFRIRGDESFRRNTDWEKMLFEDGEYPPTVITSVSNYGADKALEQEDPDKYEEQLRIAKHRNKRIKDASEGLYKSLPANHPIFTKKNLKSIVFQEDHHVREKMVRNDGELFATQDSQELDHVVVATAFFVDEQGRSFVLRNAAVIYKNPYIVNADERNAHTLEHIEYGNWLLNAGIDYPTDRNKAAVLSSVERISSRRITEESVELSQIHNEQTPESALPGYERDPSIEMALYHGKEQSPLLYLSVMKNKDGSPALKFESNSPEFEMLQGLAIPAHRDPGMPYERNPDAVFVEFATAQDGNITAIASYVTTSGGKTRRLSTVRRNASVATRTEKNEDGSWKQWTYITGETVHGARLKDVASLRKQFGDPEKIGTEISTTLKQRNQEDIADVVQQLDRRGSSNQLSPYKFVNAGLEYDGVGEPKIVHALTLNDEATGKKATVLYTARRRENLFTPQTSKRTMNVKGEKKDVHMVMPSDRTNGIESYRIHFDASGGEDVPADEFVTFGSVHEIFQSARYTFAQRERILAIMTTPLGSPEVSIERILQLFPYEINAKGESTSKLLMDKLLPFYNAAADKQVFLRELLESLMQRGGIYESEINSIFMEERITLNPDGETEYLIWGGHLVINIDAEERVHLSVKQKGKILQPPEGTVSLSGVPQRTDGTYSLGDIVSRQKGASNSVILHVEVPGMAKSHRPVKLLTYERDTEKREKVLGTTELRSKTVRVDYANSMRKTTMHNENGVKQDAYIQMTEGANFGSKGATGSYELPDGTKRKYTKFGPRANFIRVTNKDGDELSSMYFANGKMLRYRLSSAFGGDRSKLAEACNNDPEIMRMYSKLSRNLHTHLTQPSTETDPSNEKAYFAPLMSVLNLYGVDTEMVHKRKRFMGAIRLQYEKAIDKSMFLTHLIRKLEAHSTYDGQLTLKQGEKKGTYGAGSTFGSIEKYLRDAVISDHLEVAAISPEMPLAECQKLIDLHFDLRQYDDAFRHSPVIECQKKCIALMLQDHIKKNNITSWNNAILHDFFGTIDSVLDRAQEIGQGRIAGSYKMESTVDPYADKVARKDWKRAEGLNTRALYMGSNYTMHSVMDLMIHTYGVSDSSRKQFESFRVSTDKDMEKKGIYSFANLMNKKDTSVALRSWYGVTDAKTGLYYTFHISPVEFKNKENVITQHGGVMRLMRSDADLSEDWDIAGPSLTHGINTPKEDHHIPLRDLKKEKANSWIFKDNKKSIQHIRGYKRSLDRTGFRSLTVPYGKEAGNAYSLQAVKEILDLCDHEVNLQPDDKEAKKEYWKVELFLGIKEQFLQAKNQGAFLEELVSVLSGHKKLDDGTDVDGKLTSDTVPKVMLHFYNKRTTGVWTKEKKR
ncbi:MAG: hypothetical protein HN735_02520 [Candidatus Peribacter sp.]|jgi:hypothetical protein|nr:hypothetical protein [Candidatus Peribacter sp.]